MKLKMMADYNDELLLVGWEQLEKVLGALGPRMRSARRAMTPETRLDHIGVRQAARAIGISPTTYCRVEAGHIPDFRTAKKIMVWVEFYEAISKAIGKEDHE